MNLPDVSGLAPHDQHRMVMAALSTLHGHLADATSGPWHWADLDRTGYALVGAGGRLILQIPLSGRAPSHHDQAAIIAMRDQAYADTMGRRRLLERHAPDPDGQHRFCSHCVAEAARGPVPVAWPCPDYADIARAHVTGLEPPK